MRDGSLGRDGRFCSRGRCRLGRRRGEATADRPAVSKAIVQLEERLSVRLLLRTTRGLTPTEAGRNFYERAKRSIEEADGAELAARGAATTLSGQLRIQATVAFARLHIIPHLPR